MQNDFVSDGSPLKVNDAGLIIGKIQSVLEIFRKKQLPVFHVIRVHRRDGSDVEIFRSDLFKKMPFAVEGTTGAGIIGELEPREGEYLIRKTRMSAFQHTDLDLVLRTLGVDTVFVTGIQMNGAGDTRTPSVLNLIVFWVTQIPLAWLLASSLALGPNGVFWAIVISESLLTVLGVLVFRRGAWRLKQV